MAQQFVVYLERWLGLQRPRIGWWRQHVPAHFWVPGGQVSEIQRQILNQTGLTGEEVDNIHFRWQVRPHPETVEVSDEPAFIRQTGGAA